jgi:predicted enzyme related to lactoylglutathione lyase
MRGESPRKGAAMANSSIAFTMYPVTDLPRAVAFYRDALGLPTTDVQSDYWVEFDVAGATFGIGNFEQVGTPGTAQSLALEIPDLDDFRKRLAERGVEATEPHDLQFCRISVVRDPDGNQVWLHQTKPR